IEQQTDYLFFYDKAVIQKTGPIDIDIKDATLEQVLSACLKDKGLTYSVVKNTIVIRTQKKPTYFQTQTTLTQVETPKPLAVELHGRVVSRQGEPLAKVSILIEGTQIGTTTDDDGYFNLTLPD